MQPGTTLSFLKGDIMNYTYDSIEDHISQMNRFTTIQAEAMLQQGKKANLFKLLLNPPAAFISGYIIKAGFLDGSSTCRQKKLNIFRYGISKHIIDHRNI